PAARPVRGRRECGAPHRRCLAACVPRPRHHADLVPTRGYMLTKDDYAARLHRIEGQVRGIGRMVDAGTYCVDVLTQVSAVIGWLQSVAVGLLDEHVRH